MSTEKKIVISWSRALKKLWAGKQGCMLVEGCREIVSRQKRRVKGG